MRLKTLVKYQIKDVRYVFIILYLILITANILNGSVLVVDGYENTNSGMDMSSIITFFITGICCFSETFQMWIQNGLSRKNIFLGFLAGSLSISAICGILNCIFAQILYPLTKSSGSFSALSFAFTEYFDKYGYFVEVLINLIFTWITCSACIMLGYFIATLFYSAGKLLRIGIAAGLPIFTFGVLPMLLSYFYDTVLVQKLLSVFFTITGLKSGNPLYLIATMTCAFLLINALQYLVIKKIPLRT